jgi:hypothetical protein
MNTLIFIPTDVKSRRIGGAIRLRRTIGPFEHIISLKIRHEIPLYKAGRWGFETASNI